MLSNNLYLKFEFKNFLNIYENKINKMIIDCVFHQDHVKKINDISF